MTRDRKLLYALPAVLASAVYLVTRFVRLEDFPIYYLFDEAIQVCHARDWIANGFRGPGGERFPTFFPVAWDSSISVSVYLQAVGVLVHGTGSIWVSRFTSALVGCLVPLAVAWAAHGSLRLRGWWLGILVLAALPTWFLHSRTALVVPFMVAFYAVMVAGYLAAVTTSPRWLYVGALGGALAFYSYGAAQVVVPFTALLLVLVNLRFHLREWRHSLGAALLSALLLLPAILFRLRNPDLLSEQLRATESPLMRLPTWPARLEAVAASYGRLLSPAFWFFEVEGLSRHHMPGYGAFPTLLLPFFVLGLGWTLWRTREARYRSLLVVLLGVPAAGAITDPGIGRAMQFVVPAALVITAGLDLAARVLSRAVPPRLTFTAAATVLSGYSLFMLGDALRNGPTWEKDYGLYGMQWGARQLYAEAIPRFLAAHPEAVLSVSPNWANGGDVFIRFFGLTERVRSGGIRDYLGPIRPGRWQPIPGALVFVDRVEDLADVRRSRRFSPARILDIVHQPDGLPGFVFFKVDWVPDILERLERETIERQEPVPARVTIGDLADVPVLTSRGDLGAVEALFDGDPSSLFRGMEANPFVVEVSVEGRRRLSGVRVICSADAYRVRVRVTGTGDDAGRLVNEQADLERGKRGSSGRFTFAPILAEKLRVEVLESSVAPGEPAHVHLYELTPEWEKP